MAVRRSGRALGCRRVCVRDDYGALLYLFGRLPLLAWRGIVLTIGGCVKQVLLIPPQGLLRLSMSLMRCFSDVFFCSLVPSKLEQRGLASVSGNQFLQLFQAAETAD
jgi:hypothetical protein